MDFKVVLNYQKKGSADLLLEGDRTFQVVLNEKKEERRNREMGECVHGSRP